MRDVDMIREAWPWSPYGYPICAHCGGRRPGYYAFCVECWENLSAFIKMEFTRAVSRREKAEIILKSRPRLP